VLHTYTAQSPFHIKGDRNGQLASGKDILQREKDKKAEREGKSFAMTGSFPQQLYECGYFL